MLGAFFISCWILISLFSGNETDIAKPTNIILVIGDGMGLAHISMTEYLHKPPSPIARMEVIGLQKTHSIDNLETDSGAAGTAISCGVKTFNSAIGVGPDSLPLTSIMKLAKAKGMKTGFVVTSSVVHATPACFYASVISRGAYEEIAKQLVNEEIDLFAGGGEKYFNDRYTDRTDLISELENKNYEVIHYSDPVSKYKLDKINSQKKIACFTALEDPLRATNGRNYFPQLVLAAKKALKERSDVGYFLMVEGSQIDWAAHANDQEWLALELQDTYDMLELLMDDISAEENTLLIVTGDHETGYISIKGKRSPRIEFNSKVHSSQMVPVFAKGPGAASFLGVYDNTELFHKMKDLLSL